MRAAILLICLCLAGCAAPTAAVAPDGTSPSASAPSLSPSSAVPSPAAPASAAPSREAPSPAAPSPAAQTAAPPEPQPELPEADRLMQARAECWMKVERAKIARDIDRRITFVDKCVADAMKASSGK